MLHRSKYFIAILAIALTELYVFSMSQKVSYGTWLRKLPPLQRALESNNKKKFIELLMQDTCTNFEDSDVPDILHATKNSWKSWKFDFFKILISSKKVCPYYCCHNKKSFDPCKKKSIQNTFKKAIDESLKQHKYEHDYLLSEDYFPKYMVISKTPEFVSLEILTSHSQTLLRKRFKLMLNNKVPLHDLTDFARWICDFCVMVNETKDHISAIFICPACTENFKTAITKHQVEIDDLSKIRPKDFAYALITQSTENFITLLHKLLQNPDNTTSQTLLANMEKACEEHTKIWPPYAYEIKDIITNLKHRYQKKYFSLLSQLKLRNIYFTFKAT